ncbi:hypothetical protein [Anoxybacteroides tepidamans]|uniref:hypothetical protein n=1 Tax=Anoxybacteroides tepidamans TaxID=265948 RepID=UPI0005514A89|nr:hypothetical protein [Anoxybacillus tepidamans]
MLSQILLWAFLIVPWALLIFLDKKSIKRFMPAGLFSALVMTVVFQLGERLDWWTVKQTIFPLTCMSPVVYSLYVIMPIIVLRFTFNRFLTYMLTNAIIDAIYAFGTMRIYESLDIVEFNINSLGRFLIIQAAAVLIYLYQKWQDTAFSRNTVNS